MSHLAATAPATAPADTAGDPRSAARRAAILAVAQEVFLEHGFDGASMSQVAARLGGSKGTLYSYFDSKQALFEALVTDSCERNGRALFDVDPAAPLRDRLLAIARSYVALIASEWATRMIQAVAAEARQRPEIGRIFYDSGPGLAHDRLAAMIAAAAENGELVVDDTMLAAEALLALCRGKLHLKRMLGQIAAPDSATIDAYAERAVGLFLRLYGPAVTA